MDIKILEEIGLTKSEIKVYIALIELGPSSKGPIVKKAKITSSKIYEVLDKLTEKGLVSSVLKNNVKHFIASSPTRIKDYMKEKKSRLENQEKNLEKILPELTAKQKLYSEELKAQVFQGWRGLETVFEDLLKDAKRGDIDLIIGASGGFNPQRTRKFFDKYTIKAKEKGVIVKVIFQESAREYFRKSKAYKRYIIKKYLEQTTPAEINIAKDKVVIIVLSQEPLAILIKNDEIARSFKEYFNIMWKIAKK
ncbi:hypothetical protein J4414_03435 [Candidatus Woesearchaeota archaeon]|nr:hypothetical protein [Candidatus Woesearchaeota archaeon]